MRQGQVVVRVEVKLKRVFEKQCEAMGLKPSEALRSLMAAFARLQLTREMLTGEEPLTSDFSVAGYMALSEADRAALWERWYKEAKVASETVGVAVKKKIAGSNR